MTSETNTPSIGMLHALGRSGATIVARHIAAMDGLALFSEIHPNGPELALALLQPPQHFTFSLKVQAGVWFQLYSEAEAAEVFSKAGGPNDRQAVAEVLNRAMAAGRYPILRDWSHLDFIGLPFRQPTNEISLLTAIPETVSLQRVVLLRHPMGNYLSLINAPDLQAAFQGVAGFDVFMAGYRRFLDAMAETPRFHYEDFLSDRRGTIQAITQALGAPFDPDFEAKAQTYINITGDAAAKGHYAHRAEDRLVPTDIRQHAAASADYQSLMAELGHDPAIAPPGYKF